MHLSSILIIASILFVSSCSHSESNQSAQNPTVVTQKKSFFFSVPITKLTETQCPCINAEIESQSFLMKLDLGFSGHVSIQDDQLDLIAEKNFLCEKKIRGARNKRYSTTVYQIGRAKIGKMTFLKPQLQTNSQEFLHDATFAMNQTNSIAKEIGTLGWELFQNTNLLIDIAKKRIAFCNSLDALEQEGYPIENFAKTPIILENGLVKFYLDTPEGTLLSTIDTGSTWNIINRDLPNNQSLDSFLCDPENIVELSCCKINEFDFGVTKFHAFPIKMAAQVDTILGMSFIKKHAVFFDFINGIIYIEKMSADEKAGAPDLSISAPSELTKML